MSQKVIHRCASEKIAHYLLICGHYEGVDQRFLDHWVDAEISLGDFVLTGGELPAVAFADALIRQVEGVVKHEQATDNESFSLVDPASGVSLLEYPHYTRPAEFRGQRVPEILLEGNHGKIAQWRLDQARERTRQKRPDLILD
jgi:tRNA (guanine37-N1)-methyltransferase